ncbi:MAG: hypothetical protein E6G00_05645 [Actinobacteria bacterium]|nr:MAG: hypothetical protein E6G00_05645 [Actinomycetota bacterium]
MGKRSRKRSAVARVAAPGDASPAGTSRAERDAARARRARAERAGHAAATGSRARGADGFERPARRSRRRSIDERPPAPWGSFPLVELVVLLAIVLFVLGLIVGGARGSVMLTAAFVLGSLAGLELSIREHFGGFRSHTTLLAGVAAFAAMAITYFAAGRGTLARTLLVPVAGLVFVIGFWLLRQAFKRRSGGLGFR